MKFEQKHIGSLVKPQKWSEDQALILREIKGATYVCSPRNNPDMKHHYSNLDGGNPWELVKPKGLSLAEACDTRKTFVDLEKTMDPMILEGEVLIWATTKRPVAVDLLILKAQYQVIEPKKIEITAEILDGAYKAWLLGNSPLGCPAFMKKHLGLTD